MPSISWAKSLDAATRAARSGKKLVLVDFYTDWCGYCKKLEAEVFPDPRVVKAVGAVVPVRLNAEREGTALAQKFGVTSFPTLLFLDETGGEVTRINGYIPAGPFVGEVNNAVRIHRTLPAMAAKVRANPADTKGALELLKTYAQMRRTQPSEALLTQIQRFDPANARGHLAPALNLMGEINLRTASVSKARQRFAKAARVAKSPMDKGIALINLGVCDASEQKLDPAMAQWRKAKSIPGCPAELKQAADSFLQRAAAMKKGGGR